MVFKITTTSERFHGKAKTVAINSIEELLEGINNDFYIPLDEPVQIVVMWQDVDGTWVIEVYDDYRE